MKTIATLLAVAAFALAANPAAAKGCLKGAVVGGVAGHYAGHHGVLGAIAGCAYGRHHAKEQARQQHDAPAAQPPAGQGRLGGGGGRGIALSTSSRPRAGTDNHRRGWLRKVSPHRL